MAEEKNNKKFLKDKYAVKLLRDINSREYLLRIISEALKEDIGVIDEDFELLDIRVGLNNSMKNTESDIVANSKYGIINVEIKLLI